jgi:hypothetical protein
MALGLFNGVCGTLKQIEWEIFVVKFAEPTRMHVLPNMDVRLSLQNPPFSIIASNLNPLLRFAELDIITTATRMPCFKVLFNILAVRECGQVPQSISAYYVYVL